MSLNNLVNNEQYLNRLKDYVCKKYLQGVHNLSTKEIIFLTHKATHFNFNVILKELILELVQRTIDFDDFEIFVLDHVKHSPMWICRKYVTPKLNEQLGEYDMPFSRIDNYRYQTFIETVIIQFIQEFKQKSSLIEYYYYL